MMVNKHFSQSLQIVLLNPDDCFDYSQIDGIIVNILEYHCMHEWKWHDGWKFSFHL